MSALKDKGNILHTVVKEYLECMGYNHTVSAYEKELQHHDVTLEPDLLPSQLDEEKLKIQESFLKTFDDGNSKSFWLMWKNHISEELGNENDTQRLEFKLQLYFAVYPIIQDESRLSPVEPAMQDFKHYLETNGATLSQTTEFVAFYALPFVPNPKNHPTYQELFEESWQSELQKSLECFLKKVLHSEPLPYIYKLYVGSQNQSNEESVPHTKEINALKQQMKEHEDRASNNFKKYAKLQGDYHNLIGIAAELVDSLERCVRGKMVTPEYLHDICRRLFGQTVGDSADLARPGTAGDLLRASISKDQLIIPAINSNNLPPLDFEKIKRDLSSRSSPRKKTLLLQALTWRLTKSTAGEERDAAIASYISNDVLGCNKKENLLSYVSDIFKSGEDMVVEYLARFINTIASFTVGRLYLSQSDVLLKNMVILMMKQRNESAIGENILGGLQKLSLRRHVQTFLIDSAVVEWLFKMLEEPDSLSDYAIEYAVALLMNLCLRTSGKKKCCLHPEKMLKLLVDLLNLDNQEIRPYINGTLYSILALPSIKAAGEHMGLEEIFKVLVQDNTQDQHQLTFIIKQLNKAENKTDDEIVSDGEDDDEDDDEEGDAVDAESEKDESTTALIGELEGETLLCTEYLLESINKKKSIAKYKKIKSSLDEPFTRPVTPARKPTKSQSSIEVPSRPTPATVSQERPRTSSSKGNRRPPSEQAHAKGSTNELQPHQRVRSGKKFQQAFSSRPKIPRTPDVGSGSDGGSRPTSASEYPPLTRSVSPPRPNSGRGSSKISPR